MESDGRGTGQRVKPENRLYVLVLLLFAAWTVQQATLDGLLWRLVGYSWALLAVGLLFAKWRATRSG